MVELTAYDATYLSPARWSGAPLATQDDALIAAARRGAVELLE